MNFNIGNNYSGITGLFAYSPVSGEVLNKLAQEVLWEPNFSTLLPAERELIAAHVSRINECEFCYKSHRAFAEAYLGKEPVARIMDDNDFAGNIKLKGLFGLAYLVTKLPNTIKEADIEAIKNNTSVTDKEVHDTILIASMFNMYNRYVSGCGVAKPDQGQGFYDRAAKEIVESGYVRVVPA